MLEALKKFIFVIRSLPGYLILKFVVLPLFLSLILFSILYLMHSPGVLAFVGPLVSPPSGSGAIGSDAANNLSVGTTTTSGTTKFLIAASSTDTTNFALRIIQPNGTTIFAVRNDGKIGIATSTPTSTLTVQGNIFVTGSYSGSVSAGNISAGVFGSNQGSGNFSFPASLGISTTTQVGLPQVLSIYGNGYISGNLSLGSTTTSYKLDVQGDVNVSGVYRKGGTAGLTVTCSSGQTLATTTVSGGIVTGGNCVSISSGSVSGSGTANTIALWTAASALGNSFITQTGTSTVVISGGSGKLDVGTVDPIYTIAGKRYATYLPGMTGVKEETTGVLRLQRGTTRNYTQNNAEVYEYVIDFSMVEEGSDLWLFSKVTNLKNNFDKLAVLLTPSVEGNVWYEKDPVNMKLTIFAYPLNPKSYILNPELSYRLTAPRFDADSWMNYAIDGEGGFVIND